MGWSTGFTPNWKRRAEPKPGANNQPQDDFQKELDKLIAEGLVEPMKGDRYRLTAAGRAYVEARYIRGQCAKLAAEGTGQHAKPE